MGGSSTISTSEPRINGFQVQKSSYGVPIPMVWGTTRIAGNLLEHRDFKAIEHVSRQSAGGKGGVETESTTYTYQAAIMIGVAGGPIKGIRTVYRDKSVFVDAEKSALEQAGLSLALGTIGQAPWGYLTTNHATEALGYSGVAYVYAADYQLNGSAGLQNHTFEVQGLGLVDGQLDANGADIVQGFLNDPINGVPGWQSDWLADLDGYRRYCRAAGLLLSPALAEQRAAHEFLAEIARATNSEIVDSQGRLRFVPYADATVSANGVTYVPDLAPLYDLDSDMFAEPLRLVSRSDSADSYNEVQIEFLNREHQYNVETMPASDQASIEARGLRKRDPIAMHSICSAAVARTVAQLLLDRNLYVRNTYGGSLPWNYVLLEPMDLVTLTDAALGLDRQLARVVEVEEGSDGVLEIEFEEVQIGTATAATYPSQGGGGDGVNFNASPGSVSPPVIFNPPDSLLNGRLEVWAAVAGTSSSWGGCDVWVSLDGDTYKRVGAVTARARYGATTTVLPAGTDPDTANSVGVDLAASNGVLLSATQAEADAAVSLCWIGGELVSYRDATLTGSAKYTLGGYLRRGRNRTASVEHAAGTPFVRLDETLFRYEFNPAQVGSKVYAKFQSFNVFGRARQEIAELPAYEISLSPARTVPQGVANLNLVSPFEGTYLTVDWTPGQGAERSRVQIRAGAVVLRTVETTSSAFTYLLEDAEADGVVQRNYTVTVVALNAAGSSAPASIDVRNPPPPAVDGISFVPGSGGGTLSWKQSPAVDRAGYMFFYSNTPGFDPSAGQGALGYKGSALSTTLDALTPGVTYYGRIAAYDTWSNAVSELDFSAQFSFVPQ